MVEELEAMYEATTSSEFTGNKAKEILHNAPGAITPICMLQVLVGWPWFCDAKEEMSVAGLAHRPGQRVIISCL
jgi:peroxiredoxin